jgi:hypothetical protein
LNNPDYAKTIEEFEAKIKECLDDKNHSVGELEGMFYLQDEDDSDDYNDPAYQEG